MVIVACMVAYNPTDYTLKSVESYIGSVDLLVIWDNTPDCNNSVIKQLESLYPNKIKIIGEYKNMGIAYALNRLFEYADSKGADYVLTMDQDTVWENIDYYFKQVSDNIDPKVAIYAPTVKIGDKAIWCNNNQFVITSGSLNSMVAYRSIGPFREDFFIDEVDNEYCLRAVRKGYSIELVPKAYIVQTFGSPENRSWTDKYTSHYSPMRTYHQIRNRTWVWKEYHKVLSWRYFMRTLLLQSLRRSVIVVLGEKDKAGKLKGIIHGWKDGIFKSPVKV